jgi:hypothetical protein
VSIAECYVIYQDWLRDEKNLLMSRIGRCRQLLRDAGPDLRHYKLSFNTVADFDNRNACLEEIMLIINSPEWQGIKDFNTNIDDDLLFEMIMNHVKTDLISYQIFLNRFLSKEKRLLRERIKNLSANFQENFQAIADTEKLLQRISEDKIEAALYSHPVFEHINSEKMSPRFLRLAKGRDRNDSLFNIVDERGENYRTNNLCKVAVQNYFADIYEVPADAPQDFDGLIENFLGPEICNNEIVVGCRLTEREASNLDLDLTIGELDEAAGTGKIRSAPGIDGFNNFFINKFWKHFRIPLHNYMTTCFRKKILTDSFRTATIKLIPKKGDCRQLKNWRPISLLNCFYKVISRAINNRLKKFNDRFTSRAKKASPPVDFCRR